MLYRRFGVLQARLILNKQDQLRELEECLEIMDEHDDKHNRAALESREMDEASSIERRKKHLDKTEVVFKEYGRD